MVFGIFDKILCTVLGLPGPLGMAASIIVILIFAFTLFIIGSIMVKKRENVIPKWLYIFIKGIGSFFSVLFNMFRPPKSTFVSVPLEYKKQLHNDGGIGWVPYYGKPGRKCEEDKDCPTFQKCDGDKCVIPPRVR